MCSGCDMALYIRATQKIEAGAQRRSRYNRQKGHCCQGPGAIIFPVFAHCTVGISTEEATQPPGKSNSRWELPKIPQIVGS